LGDISHGQAAAGAARASFAGAHADEGAPTVAAAPTLADRGIVDADAPDSNDPNAFTDYVNEIIAFFKTIEVSKAGRFGYMSHQTDINEKMRAILIDWLTEVHLKFKLMPETLYLTVNLIDRYLEKKLVVRQKLQLVGVTAMLLASKYEEIYAPEVRDFVYITDRAYSREQILQMEATMLNTLEFRITVPTSYVFLNRFLKAAGADARTTQLATFLVERSLQEYKMLTHAPSMVAAAGVNMAMRTLRGVDAWTPTMVHYTGYTEDAIRACVRDIEFVIDAGATSSLQAVRKKYSTPKFLEVANIALARM